MMNRDDLLNAFGDLRQWKRGSTRTPHKPLLLLYVLGRWIQSSQRTFSFNEIEEPLKKLLIEFGPQRQSYNPSYPFWRLQNDGLWRTEYGQDARTRKSNTDPPVTELRRLNVAGRFPDEIYDVFEQDPGLAYEVALLLLEAHFPTTVHEDILEAVGIRREFPIRYRYKERIQRVRDPQFRYKVLVAYEQRCAVCGLAVRLDHILLGIEAAHIKWHQAGGPDEPVNGLALCVLHHKLFDRGAYTLTQDREVEVSERVNGGSGSEEWLLRHHGQLLRNPVSINYLPGERYIDWHRREVFQGPARKNR